MGHRLGLCGAVVAWIVGTAATLPAQGTSQATVKSAPRPAATAPKPAPAAPAEAPVVRPAASAVAKSQPLTPGAVANWRLQAQRAANLNDWVRETEAYSRIIEASPKDASSYFSRGLLYQKFQLHHAAERDLLKAVELNATDPYNHWALATFYRNRGRIDEALLEYARAAYLEPLKPRHIRDLNELAVERRAWKPAIAALEKYFIATNARGPVKDPLAVEAVWLAYQSMVRCQQAIADYKQAYLWERAGIDSYEKLKSSLLEIATEARHDFAMREYDQKQLEKIRELAKTQTPPQIWEEFDYLLRLGVSYSEIAIPAACYAWRHGMPEEAKRTLRFGASQNVEPDYADRLLAEAQFTPQDDVKSRAQLFEGLAYEGTFFGLRDRLERAWEEADWLMAAATNSRLIEMTVDPRTKTSGGDDPRFKIVNEREQRAFCFVKYATFHNLPDDKSHAEDLREVLALLPQKTELLGQEVALIQKWLKPQDVAGHLQAGRELLAEAEKIPLAKDREFLLQLARDNCRLALRQDAKLPAAWGLIAQSWLLAEVLRPVNTKALSAFDTAITLEPENPAWHAAVGDLLLKRLNLHAMALSHYNRAAELAPKNLDYLRRQAREMDEILKDEAGIEVNTAILSLDPKDTEALRRRGLARWRTGKLEDAIADFTAFLKTNPERHLASAAHAGRADCYDRLNRIPEAVADYRKVLETAALGIAEKKALQGNIETLNALAGDAKNATALAQRGLARKTRGDWSGALADLNRAIELDPKQGRFYLERGRIHRQRGDLNATRQDLEQAGKLDPKLANDFTFLMEQLDLGSEGAEDAVAEFVTAVKAAPNDVMAQLRAGMAWHRFGDFREALSCYTAAEQLAKNDPTAFMLKGMVYEAMGNPKLALEQFKQATIRQEDDVELLYRFGLATWNTTQLGPAEIFKRVIQRDPRHVGAHFHHGMVFKEFRDHEREEAIADFTTVLELDPNHVKALAYRGRELLRFGRTAEAEADLTRALELSPELQPWVEAQRAAVQQKEVHPDLFVSTALYKQAMECFDNKDWDGALLRLGWNIERTPHAYGPYLDRALIRIAQGDREAAAIDVNRALQLEAGSINGKILAALCNSTSGRFLDSFLKPAFERQMKSNPQWAATLNDDSLKAAMEKGREREKARKEALQAAYSRAAWKHEDANLKRALELEEQKAYQDAANLYSSINYGMGGRSVRAYRQQGDLFYRTGNHKAAADSYERLFKLFEQGQAAGHEALLPDAHYRYGLSLSNLGQGELALAQFIRTLELNPKNEEALANRAIARHQLQDMAAAIADYDLYLKLPTANPAARTYRAQALMEFDDPDSLAAALKEFQAIVSANPKDASALSSQAQALFRAAAPPEKVLAAVDAALKLTPNDGSLHLQRARANLAAAKWADATADFLQVLKLQSQQPPDPIIDFLRAKLHSGDPAELQAEVDALRKQVPNHLTRIDLEIAHAKTNKPSELDEALVAGLLERGRELAREGEWGRAFVQFSSASHCAPQRRAAEVYHERTVARLHVALGSPNRQVVRLALLDAERASRAGGKAKELAPVIAAYRSVGQFLLGQVDKAAVEKQLAAVKGDDAAKLKALFEQAQEALPKFALPTSVAAATAKKS